MQIKNFTCTACPRGCGLTVRIENSEEQNLNEITVTGNKCPKGETYGKQEAVCPMRMLTTTVACIAGGNKRLSVKLSGPVPLKSFPEYMRHIRSVTVLSSCKAGDIIVKDFCASGTDLIATGSYDISGIALNSLDGSSETGSSEGGIL